jgi:hypothetical protein
MHGETAALPGHGFQGLPSALGAQLQCLAAGMRGSAKWQATCEIARTRTVARWWIAFLGVLK